jgi:hypothetical protein
MRYGKSPKAAAFVGPPISAQSLDTEFFIDASAQHFFEANHHGGMMVFRFAALCRVRDKPAR